MKHIGHCSLFKYFFLSKPILGRVMVILPIILKHGYNIQTVSILLELVSCLSPYVWKTIGNLKKTQDKTSKTEICLLGAWKKIKKYSPKWWFLYGDIS